MDVSEDPQKPAHYLLSINPPTELRDGKSHRIDVKFRNGDKWLDFPIKWIAIFDKPGRLGLFEPLAQAVWKACHATA